MTFRLWQILALLAGVLLGAGPAVAAKDELVIGVAQFPSSLHPDVDPEVVKTYVLGFAIRPLTAFGADWKNACSFCAELPSLVNGLAKFEDRPDGGRGMAVTIKLRPDLYWGDGEPVTAKDIEFTARVGRDPNAGFSNPEGWNRTLSVDVVDSLTAVLHLKDVNNHFDRWDEMLPQHIEGPVYDKSGGAGEYIKQTTYNRAPTTPGLYDGPYLITSYESGAQIVLERNLHWAGRVPGFRRIVIKYIGNTAALQANLLSGDVDMVAGEGIGLTIDQAIALRKQQPDKFVYKFVPGLTYEHIDLNLDNPVLKDVRVRRALLYALDRKTLVDKLFEGLQPVATTFVAPLDTNYTTDVATYGYDPAKTRALLAEAGWTPGTDGVCRNDSGQRLSLDFGTTAGNRLRELTQQVLQSQWKAACIEVVIKNEPARTFFGETLKKRHYTGLAMYAWVSAPGASPRQTLYTDSIPSAANNYSNSNYPGFSEKTMDADIVRAEAELDPVALKGIWAEMQRIYADELPALPLFYRAEPHVVPKWLQGYAPTGHSYPSSETSENWRAE